MAESEIPSGAIRAAVRRASTLAKSIPTVLSVGRGFKHSGGEYLDRESHCVKFLVSRKEKNPEVRIWDTIPVRYQGRDYEVPTDVESTEEMREQGLECWRDSQRDARGTLCSLHSTSDDRVFALTAGHVLRNGAGTGIISGGVNGGHVSLEGPIVPDVTGFEEDGLHYDVGVIEFKKEDGRLTAARPWSESSRLVSSSGLSRVVYKKGGQRASGRVVGPNGSVAVMFDGVYSDPFAWKNRRYAAPLIGYRDATGSLAGGYSGSAVTDASGTKLLGLHVLGEEGGYPFGLAQSVSLLQYRIAKKLNIELELLGIIDD